MGEASLRKQSGQTMPATTQQGGAGDAQKKGETGGAVKSVPRFGEFQAGVGWYERKSQVLTLGITSSCVGDLGSIQGIELVEEGETVRRGAILATLDGSSDSVELISPVSGEILQVNELAMSDPERVSEDPVEEGWLLKIAISDPHDLLKPDLTDAVESPDGESDDDSEDGSEDDEDETDQESSDE